MTCDTHPREGNYLPCKDKHKLPGRFYVICPVCKKRLQSTKNGVFDTNPAKHRANARKTKTINFRTTEDVYNDFVESKMSKEDIFINGLYNTKAVQQ